MCMCVCVCVGPYQQWEMPCSPLEVKHVEDVEDRVIAPEGGGLL